MSLIRMHHYDEVEEIPYRHSNFFVIDFLGNNTLVSFIKREFQNVKAINHERELQGGPRIVSLRNGIEFCVYNKQLASKLMADVIASIIVEEAYCDENLLRLYVMDYKYDRINFYVNHLFSQSPFDSFKIYVVDNDIASKEDMWLAEHTYNFNILTFNRNDTFQEFIEKTNKSITYEY